MYHVIGSLLPLNEEENPNFCQRFFHDTEHELENRLGTGTNLNNELKLNGYILLVQHKGRTVSILYFVYCRRNLIPLSYLWFHEWGQITILYIATSVRLKQTILMIHIDMSYSLLKFRTKEGLPWCFLHPHKEKTINVDHDNMCFS